MKIKLFIIFISISLFSCNESNVHIPDVNFKKVLINNYDINKNKDSEIQKSEAVSFDGVIVCQKKGIKNLQGIEAFSNLKGLICNENKITDLELSNNPKLQKIRCFNNKISSLNLSKNLELKEIYCWGNNLTSLDVSQNLFLEQIWCSNNKIEKLDLSNNSKLREVYCFDNNLKELNVRNGYNSYLDFFYAHKNPNLLKIKVDPLYSTTLITKYKTNWTKPYASFYD